MNADPGCRFLLGNLPGRASGWGLLCGLLSLGSAAAEDKPAAGDGPAIPSLLMPPVHKGESDLLWRNGQSLSGGLESAADAFFVWKSPLFQTPLKLAAAGLDRVRFSSESLKRRESPFRVVLRDGSQLGGTPEAMDSGTLTFNSTHAGRIVLKQDQICLLERMDGPDLVVTGPQQLLLGTATNTVSQGQLPEPWYFSGGGQVVTPAFNQGLTLPARFPDKCQMEFAMVCDTAPAFALTLGSPDGRCTVETWGDELVLTDEAAFASAGRVYGEKDRTVQVRLTWDRAAGRSTLYAADGKVMAEMMVSPDDRTAKPKQKAKPKAKGGGLLGAVGQLLGIGGEDAESSPPAGKDPADARGLIFLNKGGGVRITRLSIAAWNGQPLQPLTAPSGEWPLIETGETVVSGRPVSLQDGILTSQQPDGTQKQWPLTSVRTLRWDRRPEIRHLPDLTNLWMADGDLIRGHLSPAPAGSIGMQTGFAGAVVPVSLTGALALELPRPEGTPPVVKAAKKKPAPDLPDSAKGLLPPPKGGGLEDQETAEDVVATGDQDLLAAKGMKLLGRIHTDGPGTLPRFQPTGAVEPAEPVQDDSLVLTWYRTPAAAPRPGQAPVLMHLRGQESLPVQLSEISRRQVRFFWQGPELHGVEAAQVEALQFPRPVLANPGFDGPGWQSLNAAKPLGPRKENRISVAPGSGIYHPFMIQGAPFGFAMKRNSGLASIRVRLFCQAPERSNADICFMIADFGGSIYCGEEQGEGRINAQEEIPAQDPVNKIQFRFPAPGKVELQVNGVTVATSNRDPKQISNRASGLVIEAASLWGNEIGESLLSDFSCQVSSFAPPPPAYAGDARKEALLLPRLRREDPPRQVLIGYNGDLLRGEIEAMTSTHLGFRAGLETFKVPIDRVAAAVWVKPPPASPKAGGPEAPAAQETRETKVFREAREAKEAKETGPARQWLDLTNGGRLALTIESWDAGAVSGQHPLLGRCRIPLELISSLSISAPPVLASHAALSDWTLQPTVDPVLPEAGAGSSPLTGTPAHKFKLPLLEGGNFALESQAGKVVVLDFWASWCGPCVKGLPDLVAAMGEFPADQVTFVGVNQGESAATVKRFLETRGLKFAVAMDADQQVAGKFAVEGIPHTVVIGPDGKVAYVKTGYAPGAAAEIAGAVRQAMAGKAAGAPAAAGRTP